MLSYRSIVLIGFVAFLFPTMSTSAQSPSEAPNELTSQINTAFEKIQASAGEYAPDLATPEAPAFTALGITPETVIRPTSAKQFAVGVLDGADPNGNFQSGLAIETSPFLLLGGNDLTINSYREDYIQRVLARTGLSFATAKGLDDDNAIRLAAGLTITPLDRGDPRAIKDKGETGLVECLAKTYADISSATTNVASRKFLPKIMEAIANNQKPVLPNQRDVDAALAEAIDAQGGLQIRNCRQEFRKENWNATAWNIGVAPTWISPRGDTSDVEWSGLSLYSTFAYGFEEVDILKDDAQLLLHARYRADEQFADSDAPDDFFEQDTLTLGGQLRFSGPSISNFDREGGPDLNFLGEVAYIHEDREGRPDEKLFRYSVGAEYRLTDDLYLKASLGTEDGRDSSDDQSFLLFNLKWDFSANPTVR